ncbi:hypothetical protein [Achromobacter kerstersii]
MAGYSHKTFIEANTGKVHRIYSYNGKPCRRFELTGRLVDQLRGYLLIEKDLRNVIEWLGQLNAEMEKLPSRPGRATKVWKFNPDRKQGLLMKALFVSSLTFYAKGYTKCEGRPVKMERQQLDENFRGVHDEVMRYRHNFAAHSGSEGIEHVRIALVIPRKAKRPVDPEIFVELNQPEAGLLLPGELSMLDLCEHARSVVKTKVDTLLKKIAVEEVAAKGWDHWYFQS